jgi:putative ABC transport system ATP-binding protein
VGHVHRTEPKEAAVNALSQPPAVVDLHGVRLAVAPGEYLVVVGPPVGPRAFHLLPYHSTVENVALALLRGGTPRRTRARLAAEALARVGLAPHRHTARARELSEAERRRVAIARALLMRPGLLLCDGPTEGLDDADANAVLDLLDDLHRAGTTVVLVTPDPRAARRAGRLVHLPDGT